MDLRSPRAVLGKQVDNDSNRLDLGSLQILVPRSSFALH